MHYRSLLFFVLALTIPSIVQAAPEGIRLLTYHNHPPFVTGSKKGLSFDLARTLSQSSQGKYLFQVQILPRSRLNLHLKDWLQDRCTHPTASCQEGWAVPWVNQKWGFGNKPNEQFRWIPILNDSNSIISLKNKKIVYHGPESLIGQRLGGIRGHAYFGIDALVKDNKIIRIDGNSERDNILKLIKKRVDALLLPTSTIHYFLSEDDKFSAFAKNIHIAPNKQQSFSRNLMIPMKRADLEQFLKQLDSNPKWQEIIKRYRFK